MLHDVHVHNGLDAPHSEAIGKGRQTLGTDITYDHMGYSMPLEEVTNDGGKDQQPITGYESVPSETENFPKAIGPSEALQTYSHLNREEADSKLDLKAANEMNFSSDVVSKVVNQYLYLYSNEVNPYLDLSRPIKELNQYLDLDPEEVNPCLDLDSKEVNQYLDLEPTGRNEYLDLDPEDVNLCLGLSPKEINQYLCSDLEPKELNQYMNLDPKEENQYLNQREANAYFDVDQEEGNQYSEIDQKEVNTYLGLGPKDVNQYLCLGLQKLRTNI